ncbi:MAG TPA: DUF3090 family protein [Actinomycetota bacterium]|nr:DUF3090 family protein [Actinomycetota bacterium]
MELDPVDKITAGTVGEPGQRTFFLQMRSEDRLVTITVEKEQVELLSSSILEILATVDLETGDGPPEDQLELETPIEPLWRAGRLSIGYSEERDQMLLELEELVPESDEEQSDEEEAAVDAPEPARLRVWATREQMLALSRHGAAVAARGRPRCQFCGNPLDPEGHMCPAMNGHRSPSGA